MFKAVQYEDDNPKKENEANQEEGTYRHSQPNQHERKYSPYPSSGKSAKNRSNF